MTLQPVIPFLGPRPVSAVEPDVGPDAVLSMEPYAEPDAEPIQMQQPTLRFLAPLILPVVIACFALTTYPHGEPTTATSHDLKRAIVKTGASAYRSEFQAKQTEVWRHAEYLSETYASAFWKKQAEIWAHLAEAAERNRPRVP
ncbi:hypothetical protein BS47DRAFT_1484497 [Hydnum rufescens UP504]|uniref:Uncharacterized protein n=1 Tax=Hydnum rufescens UP504 TaxID=1448309 RepID=A0A9P6DUM9_9AGAM|nr:hypothetical protein BS47DRAFT_1484497 [Hydnum rufescens UP504]